MFGEAKTIKAAHTVQYSSTSKIRNETVYYRIGEVCLKCKIVARFFQLMYGGSTRVVKVSVRHEKSFEKWVARTASCSVLQSNHPPPPTIPTIPTIQYNTIQYNTIQYNTIQYNTIQYNTIQYDTRRPLSTGIFSSLFAFIT